MTNYVGEIVTVWTAYADEPAPVYTGIVMAAEDGKVTIFNEEIGEETTVPVRAVRPHGEPF